MWLWVVLGVVVLLVLAGVLTQFFGTDVTFGLRSQANAPGFTDEEVALVPSSAITFIEPEVAVIEDTAAPVVEETALPVAAEDTALPSGEVPAPTDVPAQASDEPSQPELPSSEPAIQSSTVPEASTSPEPVAEDNVAVSDFSGKETVLKKSAEFIESALNKVVGANAYIVRIMLTGMTKQEIVCADFSLLDRNGNAIPVSWVGAAPDVPMIPCS